MVYLGLVFLISSNKQVKSSPTTPYSNLLEYLSNLIICVLALLADNITSKFPAFGDCSSLQHLGLSSNKFFGDIGSSLSKCGKLSFVNLTSNRLTGSVPSGRSIRFLYLQENEFQGFLQESVVSDLCDTIVELDLSFNNLTGNLPLSLGSCSLLETLDVSNNNLSGELPVDTFLKLRNLKSLVLSFNNFVGGLPDSLSSLVNLKILDVSSNNVSGLIPSGLCRDPRSSLRVLYLQNNWFTGPVPESLSNCST